MSQMPIVLQLQNEVLSSDISVTELLRKARLIATKLDLSDLLIWIEREASGYTCIETLPEYRQLHGDPRVFNPYHGWQPIFFPDSETSEIFSKAPIFQPIGSIEQMIRASDNSRVFYYSYPHELEKHLLERMKLPLEPKIHLDKSQLWNILEEVRNAILRWTLELEKGGILGEGLNFSASERKEAAPVTQQFFAQNIGIVGNVNDRANVHNEQTAVTSSQEFEKIAKLLKQIKEAIPLLPNDKQDAILGLTAEVDKEIAKSNPSRSRVQTLLTSLRSICEGAAGNLAAEGIIALLK